MDNTLSEENSIDEYSISTRDVEMIKIADLKKFSPNDIFYTFFLNEANDDSINTLNTIKNDCGIKGKDENLELITYEDILRLEDKINNSDAFDGWPSYLRPTVLKIIKVAFNQIREMEILSTDLLALLLKIKIIEIMYQQYKEVVAGIMKRQQFQDELNNLSFQTSTIEGGKKFSIKNVIQSPKKIIYDESTDVTSIPLKTGEEIVVDESIFSRISYYVFVGFYDPNLFEQLITLGVPVTSVIQICSFKKQSEINEFWENLNSYFEGYNRLTALEDTILLRYTELPNSKFENFLDVLKNYSEIQLNHLLYHENLSLHAPEHTYNPVPLICSKLYNEILNFYPPEIINVPLIIDAMVQEVCYRLNESSTNTNEHVFEEETLQCKSQINHKCKCPFNIQEFFKTKNSKPDSKCSISQTGFKVHEKDHLSIIKNTYRELSGCFYDVTLNLIKNNINVKHDIGIYPPRNVDVPHTHDRSPSETTIYDDQEIVDHFTELFFLYAMKLDKEVEIEQTGNLRLRQYLFNNNFPNYCPKILSLTEISDTELSSFNLYNSTPLYFHWIEPLSQSALVQELYLAFEKYAYSAEKFCASTDTLLVLLDDNLDKFGINVKTYDMSIRTPICIRDFCKYILFNDSVWFEKNAVALDSFHKKYDGNSKLSSCILRLSQTELFKDYMHLLNDVRTSIEIEDPKYNHDNILLMLKNYPNSTNVKQICKNGDPNNFFIGYDLGSKYLALAGHRTFFQSHDGVKVKVENTTFLDDLPSCTIVVTLGRNHLVVTSSKRFIDEPFTFHYKLKNGTIITFQQNYEDVEQQETSELSTQSSTSENYTVNEDVQIKEEKVKIKDSVLNINSVDEKYFYQRILSKKDDKLDLENMFKKRDSNYILSTVKKAVDKRCPVYKINKNTTYLKRLKTIQKVPISTIISRIVHEEIQRKSCEFEQIRLQNLGNATNTNNNGGKSLSFRISLPNGLYIRSYSSISNSDLVDIKQEFLTKGPQCDNIKYEEYRMFSRTGHILIKNCDRSCQIYTFNGDIITFEKPDNDIRNDIFKISTKPCKCPDLHSCRKQLVKILNETPKDHKQYCISRRNCIHTKKSIIPESILKWIDQLNLPYLKITILKFGGERYILENNKIKMKRLYYVVHEHDLKTEMAYFERTDNLRKIIPKDGVNQVFFPDGSKITCGFDMVDDTIEDDFVFITMNFKFEHPNYITVSYTDGETKIYLDNIILSKITNDDRYCVQFDNDSKSVVDKDSITFEKYCSQCELSYECTFQTSNFYNKIWKPEENFFKATDSYQKEFYCDFLGNCSRNSSYNSGTLNEKNCNHYVNVHYKKMFSIKRNGNGHVFWSDNMVSHTEYLYKNKKEATVTEYVYQKNDKIHFLEMKTNIYNTGLYMGIKFDRPDLTLCYSTYTLLYKMIDKSQIRGILSVFDSKLFEQKNEFAQVLEVFSTIAQHVENLNKFLIPRKLESRINLEKTCTCVVKTTSALNKISNWKKERDKYKNLLLSKELPNYFQSEYYNKYVL